ncbi:Tubulin gamma chain, related [Eimeria brunetti]|uniref:Tubulin delta chain n=1 Tax=Eimeria brunetti TaxID=51314 RepID=U6LQJ3_9EIME|nr:Tubulin gamma chain, related [Eimeria brunetti]
MSTLAVMVGGCGNYLGSELFSAIYAELLRAKSVGDSSTADSLSRQFFTGDSAAAHGNFLKARSLLIDMEAKTVQNCLLHQPLPKITEVRGGCYMGRAIPKSRTRQTETGWFWDPKFAYWQQGGCGNNWALGHEIQGPANRDNMERLLFDLAEEADSVSSVMVLHSLAGGTGSGVGSYLTELCADLLPGTCIASCCVWPFDAEVSTQAFNTVLSLASLQTNSDGIFIFENGRYAKILQRHASSSTTPTAAGLSEINRCIARDLVGCCLLPSSSAAPQTKSPSPGSSGCYHERKREHHAPWPTTVRGLLDRDATVALRCPLRDVLTEAAPHPAFKLLTCRYLPQTFLAERNTSRFTSYTFASLLHRLERMFARADTLDLLAPPSLSTPSNYRQTNYAVTQQKNRDNSRHANAKDDIHPNAAVGAQLCLRGPAARSLEGDPTAACEIALWPYALSPVQISAHPFAAHGEPCSMGLTTSCRTPLPALQSTLQLGIEMLHAGAFVHHYEEFGVGFEELQAAVEQLQEIAYAYSALGPG